MQPTKSNPYKSALFSSVVRNPRFQALPNSLQGRIIFYWQTWRYPPHLDKYTPKPLWLGDHNSISFKAGASGEASITETCIHTPTGKLYRIYASSHSYLTALALLITCRGFRAYIQSFIPRYYHRVKLRCEELRIFLHPFKRTLLRLGKIKDVSSVASEGSKRPPQLEQRDSRWELLLVERLDRYLANISVQSVPTINEARCSTGVSPNVALQSRRPPR